MTTGSSRRPGPSLAVAAGAGTGLTPALRAAALLTAWGNAALSAPGTLAVGATIAAQVGLEAQQVAWPAHAGELDFELDLDAALTELAHRGCAPLLLAAPTAGDPAGVPAGAPATAGIAAGAAVLSAGAEVVLVPALTAHGNDTEGRVLTAHWQVFEPRGAPAPPRGLTLGEASAGLAAAVSEAAGALSDLEVAAWRPEVGVTLSALREGARQARSPIPLPPNGSPRAQMLVDLAARLLVVVELARRDDGAAVAASEVRGRDAALRAVASAARQALVAGVNASFEEPATR